MAKKKYDPNMDPAAYVIPKGYTQCGGPNPEDPGCHRIVKETHVDDDGMCCFCEEPKSESQSQPKDTNTTDAPLKDESGQ